MAVPSFEDWFQELRDHPEWQAQLRSVVLTDQLLELPVTVAQLASAQRDTQLQVGTLAGETHTLAQQTQTLAQQTQVLTQHVDTLTQRVDALTEQVQVLTQRLDALTARVDALAQRLDALAQRIEALTERVDRLADAQERTEVRLQGLMEQVSTVAARADRAIGYLVEQQYRSKAHAYFQRIARRLHVLTSEELDDLLEAAIAAGTMQDWQAEQVRWADAVARGRRDGQQVLLVVEASALVEREDIDRAAQRAGYLAGTGALTIAIAAGERIAPTAALLARQQGVWLVTNGHVEDPAAA